VKVTFYESYGYVIALAVTSKGVKIPFYQSSGKNGIKGAFLPFGGWECSNSIVKNSGHKFGQLIKGLLMVDKSGKPTFIQNKLSGEAYRIYENRCVFDGVSVIKLSTEIGRVFNECSPKVNLCRGESYSHQGLNNLLRAWMKG
jgi:hypothetical protein